MVQRKQKRLGARLLGWLIVLGLIGVPIAYFYLHEEVIEVTAIRVARGHVEQTVTSISAGSVMAEQDSMIAAGLIGTLVAVPEEGQRVEEGEVLVELQHAEFDAQVALAEANLKVGLSRLEQVKLAAKIYKEINATRVSMTMAHLELAQAEFDRIKSLADRQAVSESDMDKVATVLRAAQETHSAAKASQQENLVRDEEVKSAHAAIEQIQAGIRVAKAARERAFVRAPFDGVVAKRLLDVGEATAMGVPLLQFVKDDECYVQAPFDEANAAEIKVGQKARLNLDAYRDVDFAGEVVYISPVVIIPQISLGRGGTGGTFDLSRTLEVKIRIDEGKDKFMSGMSVDVTIIADEKDAVVYVPSESLIREEYAYVVEDGRAVRRDVKTGVGNWRTVEVLDGLEEGETLITSVAVKGLEEGVKVRVVDELKD